MLRIVDRLLPPWTPFATRSPSSPARPAASAAPSPAHSPAVALTSWPSTATTTVSAPPTAGSGQRVAARRRLGSASVRRHSGRGAATVRPGRYRGQQRRRADQRSAPRHSVTEWQRILDINLMSVVRSNAAFLPLLLDRAADIWSTPPPSPGFSPTPTTGCRMRPPRPRSSDQRGPGNLLAAQEHWCHPAVPGAGADQYRRCRTEIRRRGPLRTPGEQFELLHRAGRRARLRRRVEDWDAYIDYQISREPQ